MMACLPTWPVPFTGHRTLAEVDETGRLLELKRQGRVSGGSRERRLDELLDQADRNNPPMVEPTEPESAA